MNLDYEKIDSISFTRLTNAEFIYFITRFIELLEAMQGTTGEPGNDDGGPAVQSATDGVSALNIPQEMIDAIKEALEKMQELNRETRSRVSTAKLSDIDRRRDNIVAFIIEVVDRSVGMLSDGEELDAVLELQNSLKVYSGVGKLPQNQETVTIRGMVSDIRKHSEAVETVGIAKQVDLLEEVNEQYAQLSSQRSLDVSKTRQMETAKELRAQLTTLYTAAADHAFASNLLAGTDETAAFINDLNSHIKDTKTSYNLRGSSGSDEEDGEDTGDTTDVPDDGPVVQ